MYKHIMVPVDLEHPKSLEKAINTAATLAKNDQANVCFVGITAETPTAIAHNADEYKQVLQKFAEEQAQAHGVQTSSRTYPSHDPATEINKLILQAIDDTETDLVVMASHVPTFAALFDHSHGSNVATHAKTSVFIVR